MALKSLWSTSRLETSKGKARVGVGRGQFLLGPAWPWTCPASTGRVGHVPSPNSIASVHLVGAVPFLHRFGSRLNAHFYFHLLVLDGGFSEEGHRELRFHEAPSLRPEHWERLHATVQRRVRYCARPPFAVERLHASDGQPSVSSPDARLI